MQGSLGHTKRIHTSTIVNVPEHFKRQKNSLVISYRISRALRSTKRKSATSLEC